MSRIFQTRLLFFGIAVQEYESTLIANDTPLDRYLEGNPYALTAQQITHDVVAQVLGTKVPFARPLPGQEHPTTGSLPIL